MKGFSWFKMVRGVLAGVVLAAGVNLSASGQYFAGGLVAFAGVMLILAYTESA